MLSDTGHYHACALPFHLFHHHLAHRLRVAAVEMADRLVGKDEVEGLHQRPYHSHTLLLTERHQSHLNVQFVHDAEPLEHLLYLFSGLETRETVLYLDVLECCQLGKESQFLEQITDVLLPDICPVGHSHSLDVLVVEEYLPAVVVAIAYDITAECAFALAAVRLHKVGVAFLEPHIFPPHLARDVLVILEDMRQNIIK